jgi:hypothetical protein
MAKVMRAGKGLRTSGDPGYCEPKSKQFSARYFRTDCFVGYAASQ